MSYRRHTEHEISTSRGNLGDFLFHYYFLFFHRGRCCDTRARVLSLFIEPIHREEKEKKGTDFHFVSKWWFAVSFDVKKKYLRVIYESNSRYRLILHNAARCNVKKIVEFQSSPPTSLLEFGNCCAIYRNTYHRQFIGNGISRQLIPVQFSNTARILIHVEI